MSEEAHAAAANESTPASVTLSKVASEEMEPGTETTNRDDSMEQDDDFGDFAAAASSDVDDAKGEQTDDKHDTLESDLNPDQTQEINDTEDDDFGEFESTSDNYGGHAVEDCERHQRSPPDAFDDHFPHLSTADTSEGGAGVGEGVPNDETALVDNTVVCDVEQEERSADDSAIHSPKHSSKNSDTETKNGSDNGQVAAPPPESDDFGESETPKDPLNDSEEQQVSPCDALDDPFAHLSTGVDETSCLSKNDTEECATDTIISDSPHEVQTDNDDEFFSTHPSNGNSENGASESDSVVSETGDESCSSPDNDADAGYFSAVTDGDEQSNEDDIQLNDRSVPAETMIQASTNTEEMMVNDNDHSGADSKMTPDAEIISSAEIDETKKDTADPTFTGVDASDRFGAFEQVAINVASTKESQVENTEITNNMVVTEEGVAEESDLPGMVKESAIAGEMIAAEGAVDGENISDDNFGDFGVASFEQADNAPNEVANDLEAPDAALPENEPNDGVDDDFGDFGSFEQAETTHEGPQALVLQTQENDDEDFGEFGDFTDFSSETPAQQDDNIDTAVTSVENTGPPPAHPPATNILDPIVSKAEIIFKEIFARDHLPSEDDQHASERVVVKITSSLTELGTAKVNEDPSSWLVDSIASVMRGVEHLDKSGPIAIVNPSSDYPYAHFTVPVCGLPLTKVDISGRSFHRLQRKKSQDNIEFTESQDYSVGASFSADTEASAEPQFVQPQAAQQSTGTVVSLPPLKSDANTTSHNGAGLVDAGFADFQSSNDASESSRSSYNSGNESNGKKDTLSSSAKQFLQQIPDLSFMLKPTLSLPKKS